MIDLAIETIRALGLLNGECLTANAVIGRSVNVQVFGQSKAFYNVKISAISLDGEYSAGKLACSIMPENVAAPITLRRAMGMNMLVSTGIYSEPVKSLTTSLSEFLMQYLAKSDQGFRSHAPMRHRALLQEVVARHDIPAAATIGRWLQSPESAFLDAMPLVRQHGDFVPQNLAISDAHYVVFDWEDFGRVLLPGFDIFMLIVGFLEFRFDRLTAVMDGRDAAISRAAFQHLLHYLDVDRKVFRDLAVIYIFLFYDLKKALGYRQNTSEMIERLLEELIRNFWNAD